MSPLQIDQQFGRLRVVEVFRKGRVEMAKCQCSCGGEIFASARKLRKGDQRSCGCYHHGRRNSKCYSSWKAMRTRCTNPNAVNYERYGRKGTKVCKELMSFRGFYALLGDPPTNKHTLDRIESALHYSCGKCDDCRSNMWSLNVRWATPKEQSLNRSSTRYLTFNGETLCLKDWAKKIGMNRLTLGSRINTYGWSAEKALATPARNKKIKMNTNFPPELFWRRFLNTPGAIGCAEAIAIFNLAKQAPSGIRIDIGSHAGKAAQAAAAGLSNGDFYLIDPCYDLSNREAWSHSVQGTPENMPWAYVNEPDFQEKVIENIKIVSAMEVTAKLVGDYSEKVLPEFNKYSWIFIDSDDHCGGMAIREAKIIEDRVVKGGIIAFHDVDNQFQDPRSAINYLVSTGKFEEIEIDWKSIFNYVRASDIESKNNSWHGAGSNEFPCYVGAVRRK